jgi:hypothetical protein
MPSVGLSEPCTNCDGMPLSGSDVVHWGAQNLDHAGGALLRVWRHQLVGVDLTFLEMDAAAVQLGSCLMAVGLTSRGWR